MILLIGTKNCSKCEMTKGILDKKEIEYEYKIINDLNKEDQLIYMNMAKEKGIAFFPLVIKDNKIIDIQEVI
jgi:glutaredoxin